MLIVTLGFGSVTWISNLLMEVDGGWSFLSWFELYINHNTNALSFRYVSPTLLIIIIGAMTLGCVVSSLCSGGWERRCLHMQWKGGLIV